MEKIDGLSKDIEQTEREKLASVFPQCFVEGKLDIDKLLSLCGEYMLKDFEKYEFTWKGKSECLPLAQQRSTCALRPCPEESVDFETTQNLYIEGDNLEVLKLLQTSYFRQIKMIYIDPPYNTGHDFVYEDDFKDPLERYKEVTSQTTKSNPEYMGRFHTRWLNMMYPRLRLAANLLRDDGVIFISIDDHEVHNLRKLCDEIFGEENFVVQLIWKNGATSASHFCTEHEYILAYAKRKELLPLFLFNGEGTIIERALKRPSYKNPVSKIEFKAGIDFQSSDKVFPDLIGDAEPIRTVQGILEAKGGKLANDVVLEAAWTMRDMIINWLSGDVIFDQKGQKIKRFFFKDNGVLHYEKERGTVHPKSVIEGFTTKSGGKSLMSLELPGIFDFPKPVGLLSSLIGFVSNADDIILDFFSGSATTAHAVMQLNAEDGGNRRFIMVQLPELCDEKSEAFKAGYKNICEIGKERIRRAGVKILENVESTKQNERQKAQDKEQLSLVSDIDNSLTNSTLDIGFKVFKLDSSNLKIWDSSRFPEDDLISIKNRLYNMIDRIKPDRSDLDVVYEIMLKLGVPLTYHVIPMEITGGNPATKKTAYSIGDECLFICLADNLTTEMIEEMAEYAPGQIILAEHSLADLSAMRNAHYVLRDRNIELKLV